MALRAVSAKSAVRPTVARASVKPVAALKPAQKLALAGAASVALLAASSSSVRPRDIAAWVISWGPASLDGSCQTALHLPLRDDQSAGYLLARTHTGADLVQRGMRASSET